MPKPLSFLLFAIAAAGALVGAPAPASAQNSAARLHSDKTLKEFVGTCAGVDNLETLLAAAEWRGWQRIDPIDHPFAARRLAGFETSMAGHAGGQRTLIAAFRRMINGYELVLIVQDLLLPNSRVIPRVSSCEIFDLAEAPTYESLQSVFGKQRSHYDDTLPPAPDLDSTDGGSWYDDFGLPGASITRVGIWRDEVEGRYTVYEASKQYGVTPQGPMPKIPPPPRPIGLFQDKKPQSHEHRD